MAKQGESSFTLRHPPHTYLHLRLNTLSRRSGISSSNVSHPTEPSSTSSTDEITIRQYLNQALTQYLGLTGSAIDIDILKVEDHDTFVRVDGDDGIAVMAALSQWAGKDVSVQVVRKSSWLGSLMDGAGGANQRLWSLEG